MRTIVAAGAVAGLVMASPADAQIAVTSSTLMERAALPAEQYKGSISIRNASNAVQVVSLSLGDYRFSADGTNAFDEPGSQSRSNSAWIELSQRAVSVLPHAEIAVAFTVSVPKDPQLVGTYWSVVLVEAARTAPAAASQPTFAVATRFRYAVQVATHIGATGEPTLSFGQPTVVRRAFGVNLAPSGAPALSQVARDTVLPADRTLAIDIGHSGTRGCRPTIRLEVYGADGTLAHSASAQRGLVYPGTSIRQAFELPPIAPGDYTFLVLADVGADKVQGTRFQVHIQ